MLPRGPDAGLHRSLDVASGALEELQGVVLGGAGSPQGGLGQLLAAARRMGGDLWDELHQVCAACAVRSHVQGCCVRAHNPPILPSPAPTRRSPLHWGTHAPQTTPGLPPNP